MILRHEMILSVVFYKRKNIISYKKNLNLRKIIPEVVLAIEGNYNFKKPQILIYFFTDNKTICQFSFSIISVKK